MKMTAKTVRLGLCGMFAGGVLSAAIALPNANAAPPDTCTASGVANTVNSVSASISQYLTTHPDTDKALTDIGKQPAQQQNASFHTYFTNNPGVANDLRNLQKPLTDMNSECGVAVSPSQAVTAFQAL
jgi:heme-binding protein